MYVCVCLYYLCIIFRPTERWIMRTISRKILLYTLVMARECERGKLKCNFSFWWSCIKSNGAAKNENQLISEMKLCNHPFTALNRMIELSASTSNLLFSFLFACFIIISASPIRNSKNGNKMWKTHLNITNCIGN